MSSPIGIAVSYIFVVVSGTRMKYFKYLNSRCLQLSALILIWARVEVMLKFK
jgi:hypothetical protein